MSTFQVIYQHLQAVKNPRLQETPFRSPQLTLFDLGPDEWLLYWKIPDHTPTYRRRRISEMVQLPLFDLPPLDMAVGADSGRSVARSSTHLHLVWGPVSHLDAEE